MPPLLRSVSYQHQPPPFHAPLRGTIRRDGPPRGLPQLYPLFRQPMEGKCAAHGLRQLSGGSWYNLRSHLRQKQPFRRNEEAPSSQERSGRTVCNDAGNWRRRNNRRGSFFDHPHPVGPALFAAESHRSSVVRAGSVAFSSSPADKSLVHRRPQQFYRTGRLPGLHAGSFRWEGKKTALKEGSGSLDSESTRKTAGKVTRKSFCFPSGCEDVYRENCRPFPTSLLFPRLFDSSSESSQQRQSESGQRSTAGFSLERGLVTVGDADSEDEQRYVHDEQDGEDSYPFSWLFRPLNFLGAAFAAAGTASLYWSSSSTSSSVTSSSSRSSPPSLSFLFSRRSFSFFPRSRAAPSSCCGIVAYVGDKEAEPLLMEGLEILQNRGYDSCGISSISPEGTLITTKFASKGSTCDSIEILKRESKIPHKGNKIGIAHTRWATHGSKTDENAHPHHDWKNRISLVHNGTIDNYAALKKALISRGCTFRSQTDSEVIANLIGWYLDQPEDEEEEEEEVRRHVSTDDQQDNVVSPAEPDEKYLASAKDPLPDVEQESTDDKAGDDLLIARRRTTSGTGGEEVMEEVVVVEVGGEEGAGGKRQRKTLSFEEAVKRAVGELQGTWGLCILHKDYPDRLILARNGSPLLVGAAGGQVFVASEPAALAQHTNQYLMLRDGEIAVVTPQGIGQLEASGRTVHRISQEMKTETSPSPFLHWTVKEIFEQPQALGRAMNNGGRIAPYKSRVKLGGLDQNREALLEIKNLLICGCGTSLYAGMYGELLMQWLRCFDQVRAVDASEVDLHQFPRAEAGMLLLSQSGETLDTVRACQLADVQGVKKFSVVNQVGSLLARMTNCGVYVNAGREVAVASTKAFSSQVAVLSLIAAWFAQNQSEQQLYPDRCSALMDALHRLPVYAGMTLNCRNACKELALKLKDTRTIFILGKGFGYPVALEGALKIKEVAYIHAEGFPAGALKHGPFALIDEKEKTPVILLILSDQHAACLLNAAQQVKARGAYLICITDEPEMVRDIADDILVVPTNGPLTALLACIPLQLLAYELAVSKGLNPDKPRGLAKTVTVI